MRKNDEAGKTRNSRELLKRKLWTSGGKISEKNLQNFGTNLKRRDLHAVFAMNPAKQFV